MFKLPLIFIPSGKVLSTPPTKRSKSAFLISSIPNISGAIDLAKFIYKDLSFFNILIVSEFIFVS